MKILIITDTYLPGFKGGGPVKTIKNLVHTMSKNYEFNIITSDRDIGDKVAYKDLKKNVWINKENYKIIYLDPLQQNLQGLKKQLSSYYDVIYMNSLFSKYSIYVLILLKLKLIKTNKIILAPRGEMSLSALKFKNFKKIFFLKTAKALRLYSNVHFQATSFNEKNDIIRELDIDTKLVKYLPNIAGYTEFENISTKNINELKIVFISRIHPIKNLKYVMKVLDNIKQVQIHLDIYGPMEDEKYFNECITYAKSLTSNVFITYKGSLEQSLVQKTLRHYNLFFLPTLGENYGHSIVEALLTNTPVLISDQTPWNMINENNAGRAISLENEVEFVKYVEELARKNDKEFREIVLNVNQFKEKYILGKGLVEEYEAFFKTRI